jgi:hypothetical protein
MCKLPTKIKENEKMKMFSKNTFPLVCVENTHRKHSKQYRGGENLKNSQRKKRG